MIAILSPAKSLNHEPIATKLPPSPPSFIEDRIELAKLAKTLNPADLRALMHISEPLAQLNYDRFQALEFPLSLGTSLPAALLFDGDVYKGLRARELSDDGLAWANDHLRILSGLYGLLKPLELVHPYRLEMGTKLKNPRGPNLYKFWGTKLAERLNEEVTSHQDPVIVDLASKEYSRAVPKRALRAEVLTVNFKEIRDGKPKVISFFAKKARGQFARYMIDTRAAHRDELRGFSEDRYRFNEALSSDSDWVFSRVSA